MSKLAAGVAIVAVGTAGFAWFQQDRANAALRVELTKLRGEIEGVGREKASAPVSQKNDPAAATVARGESEELAKLRAEVTSLQKQAKEFARAMQQQPAPVAPANQNPTAAVPTKLTAVAQLKNAGKASPTATAETLFWAASGGELDALAGTFSLTDGARTKADAWFASLSDATRQQYGSPEKLMALMIARDAAPISGIQVLGERAVTDDNVGVRIRFGTEEGRVKDENYFFRRTADGWRLVVPENAVEKYARQLSGGK